MDDKKHDEGLSRRSFLASLGKWSSIVVATAALGISEASAHDELPKEGSSAREEIPGRFRTNEEAMEPHWRRCRVWGNGGGGVWGNGGGGVWGNGASGCRVWGNAGKCRVWGNR